MSEMTDSLDRIESTTDGVENPVGEWFLIEDDDGTIVECTDVTDDGRAVLHDEWGTKFIVPRTHIGTTYPRVRGRNDPRPPSEVAE